MAGVAAVLGRKGPPGQEAAQRMLAAARHRGSLTETLECGSAVLAVATVPDLPEAEVAATDGWAAAFTGRLDNPPEIAHRLGLRGSGDERYAPPVLLIDAFRRFGDEAPSLLRGAFAAVITDGRRLWSFRDQVGFETLFYRDEADGFYVASEAKQIVAGTRLRREPDIETLEQIFYDSVEDPTRTAVEGVQRLLHGTLLHADQDRSWSKRYWNPEALLETGRPSDEEVAARFEEVMGRAVGRVLTGADAVSLSGGIDSPALAAFAAPEHRRLYGRPLAALSAVYPGFPVADERAYIEDVATSLGISLSTYEPLPQTLTRLREWVDLFDGPWKTWSPSGAEQRLALAGQLGFRTILDGNMAEQVMAMQRFLVAHLLTRGRMMAALRYLRQDWAEAASVRRIIRQLITPFVPRWAVATYLRRNPMLGVPEWLDRSRIDAGRIQAAKPLRHMWVAGQLGGFGGSSLALEASAVLYSIFGVRERMPWGDVDLWEFFLSLPAEIKFPNAVIKGLTRKLLTGRVPATILQRRDKSIMNEWFEATSMDYDSLGRWLSRPKHRVRGIDYRSLAQRLEDRDMALPEYVWAKDLAAIHAFLDLW
jgi:asparagine synthase (glutamine-hydrolysing)